ncbi:hypothetical protein M422DRAFT_264657 [Sphaerobolus stellatus SS14]|uniref:Uncharacterized protein n=1 Tax=Sphaerobolus stellatus (strain SS14) TaxID=990650 RepID=A0A0C9TT04_SPHS4|nr:hypothetical protein M422DRAFT_264657 [Sphaerobolus stellatus SS14]
MPYHYPITDEELAPFLDAVKSLPIPMNKVPPAVIEEVPSPSMSSNPLIVMMKQALIDETIKMNTKNAKEYQERETKAEAAAKKAEEDVKAAAEKEKEHARDANSEDETPKSKSKLKKTKLRSIVGSESEEETKEVKAKRRKAKGKGKAIDTEYKRNTIPVNYIGCPGVPVRKICEGCKVPRNTWYQRPCVGNAIMDAYDQIFSVSKKEHSFICLLQNNVCLFTRKDKADFIMPEATDDEELQAKLRKLCDKQDMFKKQKDKERVERNKILGNSTKAGIKKKVEVNGKALGSTLKRARMVANSTGSNERIPSVTESLHGINKALIETVNLLGDTQAANERQARALCGIKTCMVNLQHAMQTHDEEFVDEEVEPAELGDMEEEVEEVCKEVEEVHKEDKGGREVETMKDLEADKL